MITTTDLRRRLSGPLASPVVRSGLHLVASAGVTSVLGLAYWSLAAHRYSPAAVGATAALLAAMELVAAVANLGLRTALIRFVPGLGDRAARVVAVSYLVSGGVALAGGAAFVAVHGRWFPELTLLDQAPGAGFFLLSTVLWVIFILQDSVLVGLRRSRWVPIENALFAVAKLGLLVALTAPMPHWGIYVSWSAPLVAVVLVVNLAVFRLLRRPAPTPPEDLTVTDLVRFSAGDYLASALWLATIDGLPLLVLAVVGASGSAWYHLAWTVAYTIYVVPGAVGAALLAETAHVPSELAANTRRSAVQSLALVVPAALVMAVGAPLVLDLFGSRYAAEAAPLLRLLALSAIPNVITGLYVNVERAQRRIGRVVRLYVVLCLGVVLGSAALVPALGVVGAGMAWLVVQSALALWLLATRLRDLWVGALPTPWLRRLGAPRAWLGRLGLRRRAWQVVPTVLGRVRPGTDRWTLLHATPDLLVVDLGGVPRTVLKLPISHEAELARRREMAVLNELRGDPRAAGWAEGVPRVVGHGTEGHQAWSVETAPGATDGAAALGRGLAPDRLLAQGTVLLGGLHAATATPRVVDEACLRAWVDEPAGLVATACPDAAAGLAELVTTLRLVLDGRQVTTAWTHGDVSPANLMVDDAGSVTGIVDWEAGAADRLPEIDLVGLVASTRALARTEELGEVVLALTRRPWTEEEVAVLAAGPNGHLPRPALVLLAWLHHVASNVAKSATYGANRAWVLRNVLAVTGAGSGHRDSFPDADLEAQNGPPAPAVAIAVERRPRTARSWLWAVPPLALAGWALGLHGADPRELSDLGLVSIVAPVGFVALGLLAVGFALALVRRPFGEWLVTTHVATLVLILFGTPAVAYDTLRYSWAWKHVGIVDYIDRVGHVSPGIDVLPVYHNWPGFFAGSHLLQTWVGAGDAITIARWFPLVMALATTAAVVLLAATFTTDRRVVWLTAWLFLLGDWVGQEYFSPQALAYLLYVVSLALALRTFGRDGPTPFPRKGQVTVVALVAMAGAIATSHQLTPAMLFVALLALAVTRRARIGPLALAAGLAMVTWALWGASDFVVDNVVDLVEGLGAPVANAEGNLTSARLNDAQALVSQAGRGVVVLVALLALVGVVRAWRQDRRAMLTPLVLLACPAVLLGANDFDGEILFRVYLFALPMAAWFGARALLDLPGLRGGFAALAPLAVSLVLLPGFLLAHFGKDGHYVFTPEEVAAATWLDEHAPPGSLLIEGSRNYPDQFLNYEHFRYVPLDREPVEGQRRILRRPVRVLAEWMSDPRDAAAYVILTRSQAREHDALGYRPPHLVQRLWRQLAASPRFTVAYENRDAVVFTLTERRP